MEQTENQTKPAGGHSLSTDVLAACPFCGGEAAHNKVTYSDREIVRLNGQDTFYGVNCIRCGANTLGLIGQKTPEEAARKWNTRVATNEKLKGRP